MRDNEPIDDIPSMAPARDEIASFGRGREGAPVTRAEGGMGGGARFFLFLAFMLAVAACAAAGFLYQELQQSGMALDDAVERVAELEDTLSSSNESVSESAAVQGVKIKELDSEVRKLWDSAWKRNQKQLGEQGKSLKSAELKLGGVSKTLESQKAELATLSEKLSAMQLLATQVREAQSKGIALEAKLSGMEEGLAAAKISVDGMRKKVVENTEWVKSFNTFRRQTNSRINQLEQSRASTAPATVQ